MLQASARRITGALFLLTTVWAASPSLVRASDHADTPLLMSIGRHDARISDLFAFQRGDRLVLILNTNPSIPNSVTQYAWPRDLKLQISIDNHSQVSFADEAANATYGGRVVNPAGISADIVFDIDMARGFPRIVKFTGLPPGTRQQIRFFQGLRDDPFIRGPLIGKNIAAIVLDLPLASFLKGSPTLLLWATSKVPGVNGPQADFVGRSLRSQLPENDPLNSLHPRRHLSDLGVTPDVMIYDTSEPAAFPNGRELADDVVDLVGDVRLLNTDAPFPAANDVPFLNTFPYLAEPHP